MCTVVCFIRTLFCVVSHSLGERASRSSEKPSPRAALGAFLAADSTQLLPVAQIAPKGHPHGGANRVSQSLWCSPSRPCRKRFWIPMRVDCRPAPKSLRMPAKEGSPSNSLFVQLDEHFLHYFSRGFSKTKLSYILFC
jgi:hypothetical protein